MKKDEFYVGYNENQPKEITSFLKKKVILLLVIVIVVAAIFSLAQKPFKNSTFELGEITEIEGTLYTKPYPMLRVLDGNSFKNIILLGFGKFGPQKNLKDIESKLMASAEGTRLALQGTLIYYNGKTLMQLEPTIFDTYKNLGIDGSIRMRVSKGEVTLKGEIVDPKCYFGVMKPGFGKIHRSCAVRCISGGIPPVLVVKDERDIESYYLLTNHSDNPINSDVIDLIGKPLVVNGQLEKLEDWNVLKIDPHKDIQLLDKESGIYTH